MRNSEEKLKQKDHADTVIDDFTWLPIRSSSTAVESKRNASKRITILNKLLLIFVALFSNVRYDYMISIYYNDRIDVLLNSIFALMRNT